LLRPAIDLHRMIREMLSHASPLPQESNCPIRHFEQLISFGASLAKYLDDHIEQEGIYAAVYDRHFAHLRRMILADLIESFERFLKELAAACIDLLAPHVVDDRFDAFVPKGRDVSAIVHAGSIGRALCESDTWLNNETINSRFSNLLKDLNADRKWEQLFPRQPATHWETGRTLAVLWQVRHTLAHNVGVLTSADSMKLRLLGNTQVPREQRLAPTVDDLRYVRRFLAETAASTNERVSIRIGELMTAIRQADRSLFDGQDQADLVTRTLGIAVTIDGFIGQA
jgi:hypothetical protein